MYRRYYTPFDENPVTRDIEPEVIKPRKLENEREETKTPPPECETPERENTQSVLGSLSTEDIILIGILILLFMEEKDNRDMPLLLAIGFLLIMGHLG